VPPGGMELFDPRGKYNMDYREEAEKEVGDPVLDFQIDLDKINAITPDDINPYIPFPELGVDIKPVVTPIDDGIAYKGGSKDFDETGGGFNGIDFGMPRLPDPPKAIPPQTFIEQLPPRNIRPPMPPSIGRPPSPILGGSDYMPKPIFEPVAPKPKPKPKPRRKPKNMIFAGARPKSRGTVRMGRGR